MSSCQTGEKVGVGKRSATKWVWVMAPGYLPWLTYIWKVKLHGVGAPGLSNFKPMSKRTCCLDPNSYTIMNPHCGVVGNSNPRAAAHVVHLPHPRLSSNETVPTVPATVPAVRNGPSDLFKSNRSFESSNDRTCGPTDLSATGQARHALLKMLVGSLCH